MDTLRGEGPGRRERSKGRAGFGLSQTDARRIVTEYVEHYNTVRLHSALGYLTPRDQLEGRAEQIFAARDVKLEAARQARRTAAMTPAHEGE